jgi:hypothetical protein
MQAAVSRYKQDEPELFEFTGTEIGNNPSQSMLRDFAYTFCILPFLGAPESPLWQGTLKICEVLARFFNNTIDLTAFHCSFPLIQHCEVNCTSNNHTFWKVFY